MFGSIFISYREQRSLLRDVHFGSKPSDLSGKFFLLNLFAGKGGLSSLYGQIWYFAGRNLSTALLRELIALEVRTVSHVLCERVTTARILRVLPLTPDCQLLMRTTSLPIGVNRGVTIRLNWYWSLGEWTCFQVWRSGSRESRICQN